MRRRVRKSKGSCRILRAKIGKARTRTARGKALGAFSKAGCGRHRRRSKR